MPPSTADASVIRARDEAASIRETLAVAAGRSSDSAFAAERTAGASVELRARRRPEYSRDDGTPTWAAFEAVVGSLEDAEAVAFSSGMAAIAAVFDQLPAGARIVWPDDCYQGVAGMIADGERLGRWTTIRLAVDRHRRLVRRGRDR